ncbi:MAG: hypothetical protein V4544_05755 [Pseudomonadota bacterium]
MQIKSICENKKMPSESRLSKPMPVIEGINNQIKVLRSMMMRIDDRSTRTASNRVSEMRSTIIFGSIFPLQNLKSSSLFFCSK